MIGGESCGTGSEVTALRQLQWRACCPAGLPGLSRALPSRRGRRWSWLLGRRCRLGDRFAWRPSAGDDGALTSCAVAATAGSGLAGLAFGSTAAAGLPAELGAAALGGIGSYDARADGKASTTGTGQSAAGCPSIGVTVQRRPRGAAGTTAGVSGGERQSAAPGCHSRAPTLAPKATRPSAPMAHQARLRSLRLGNDRRAGTAAKVSGIAPGPVVGSQSALALPRRGGRRASPGRLLSHSWSLVWPSLRSLSARSPYRRVRSCQPCSL